MVYEADMHTFYKGAPDFVVLPETTREVAEVVRLCHREHVAVVPRGSGTGLIGGAMAPAGGVMVSMTRMNNILDLDFPNRCATVQPGLINLWLSQATRAQGYYFAPDPSSQMVSSIGGNASTNAGGPHCLKYGITVNHVLGLEVVTGRGRSCVSAARRRIRPVTTSPVRSSARKARSGSSPPSRCVSSTYRPRSRRSSRPSRPSRMLPRQCPPSSPPASCPRRSR